MVDGDCSGGNDQLDFAAGIAGTAGVDGNCDVAAVGAVRVCRQAFAAFGGGCAAVSWANHSVCGECFCNTGATRSTAIAWDRVCLGGRGVLFARGSASLELIWKEAVSRAMGGMSGAWLKVVGNRVCGEHLSRL